MFKKIFSFLFVLAFASALIFVTIKIWKKQNNVAAENIKLQNEFIKKRNEADKLNQINQEKKDKIESISKNVSDVIEDKARKDFGMVGEGETYYHAENTDGADNTKNVKDKKSSK